jgi:hypothetical protein
MKLQTIGLSGLSLDWVTGDILGHEPRLQAQGYPTLGFEVIGTFQRDARGNAINYGPWHPSTNHAQAWALVSHVLLSAQPMSLGTYKGPKGAAVGLSCHRGAMTAPDLLTCLLRMYVTLERGLVVDVPDAVGQFF